MEERISDSDRSLMPVSVEHCQIETPDDIVVLVHTAVGDNLRGVATRRDETVEIIYARDDIDSNAFGKRVGGLPPVPSDAAFFTVGDDRRSLVWTAFEEGGVAIGIDATCSIPIAPLVEWLQTVGLD